jgi:hypothetical protein
MKQAKPMGEDPSALVALDRDGATQNFRHFMNVLNCRVYGTAFKRHGRRLREIPVIEHDDVTHWHYHAAIDCPTHVDAAAFPDLLREVWASTYWSHKEVHITPGADDGWVNYMLKSQTKDRYDLCIDWLNFHNP